MQIILQEDVANLGVIGDVVKVRDGYGRNYLIPRGLAVEANRRNLRVLEHQKRLTATKKEKDRQQAQEAGPEEGYPVQDLVEEIISRLARPDARDVAIVLLQVISNILGVEHDRRVDEGEAEDQDEFNQHVPERAVEVGPEGMHPRHRLGQEADDRLRHHQH